MHFEGGETELRQCLLVPMPALLAAETGTKGAPRGEERSRGLFACAGELGKEERVVPTSDLAERSKPTKP